LSIGDDHCGFALWCSQHITKLVDIAKVSANYSSDFPAYVQIYGEWAGLGVQKGTNDAICKATDKHFFIFAIQVDDLMCSNLHHIQEFFHIEMDNNMHILPELGRVSLSMNTMENIDEPLRTINQLVSGMELTDSYICDLLGLEGTGEGLVGTRADVVDRDTYFNYAFKAKTAAHSVRAQKKPAGIEPLPQDVIAFAYAYATPARLLQCVNELDIVYDMKETSAVMKWMAKDIIKEGEEELIEMGYEWKKISKTVHAIILNMWKEKVHGV
jgi:hypothetical protein